MTAPGRDLLDRLVLLTHGLQAAGVPAGLADTLDAAKAMACIDLVDRELLRTALRATLVKRPDDLGTFDLLFDRYFSVGRFHDESMEPTHAATQPNRELAGDLVQQLLDAIDHCALSEFAKKLVAMFSGIGQAIGTERYHLQRVLRGADVSRLVADAALVLRARIDHSDALSARLVASEQNAMLDDFRRLIADEVRRRLVDEGDLHAVVRSTRLDELEVMPASTSELRALREAVRPLARKLASRMAQRRRLKQRGRLDIRRTVRRSLQTGGVPMHPSFRDRRASKPDVVVLCDVSGSVAEFANFTLLLLTALHGEMARLRSFVFVDGLSEVTDLLTNSEYAVDPRFLVSRPGVVVGDGHSDYARVFERFVSHHISIVRPTTTVIIAGDARTNDRPTGEDALAEIRVRAKRVLWFNPEPWHEWDTTDSRMSNYRRHCDAAFEVRTLRQLADAIAALA